MRNEAFRLKLQEELVERTKRNPSFSARAFARQLNIEHSSLSQILNGKRTLTDKMCKRLAERLSLAPNEMYALMGVQHQTEHQAPLSKFTNLSVDHFKVIADWYHYAILELTHLPHFEGSASWIAKALGVKVYEVRAAIERLLRLEYLEITSCGKWIDRLGDAANSGTEFTAPALRKLQQQILEKAADALDNTPYDERVQLSNTLPVSKKKLKTAKKKVLNFLEDLDSYLREDEEPDEIYNMSISLYPISQTKRSKA